MNASFIMHKIRMAAATISIVIISGFHYYPADGHCPQPAQTNYD